MVKVQQQSIDYALWFLSWFKETCIIPRLNKFLEIFNGIHCLCFDVLDLSYTNECLTAGCFSELMEALNFLFTQNLCARFQGHGSSLHCSHPHYIITLRNTRLP